jgi:(R,R)-butanediol dehydrogenase/meso-butanediol dehydrogenase/diacetyl reductase
MKAAVFEGNGRLALKDIDAPKIAAPDEVLLKVEAASICGSDLKILEVPPGQPAKPGIVLGHEFVGQVVETGPGVKGLQPGDRVVTLPDVPCGYCAYCQSGKQNLCLNMVSLGVDIDGCFAEYVAVPARVLYKVSPDLPTERAIFAEPLACAVNALSKVSVVPGQDALVLGAGPMGLYFLLLLKASGIARVLVSEPNPFRAGFAAKLGADRVINPKEKELAPETRALTGLGVDLCIDAVGSLLDTAVGCLKRGGTALLLGLDTRARPCVQQSLLVERDIRIIGSFIAGYAFPQTIRILESGLLPLERIITHRLPLREIGDGIELMKSGAGLEIVIYPDERT